MRIKAGVRIHGLRPEMTVATQIIDGIYRSHDSELVITSALDGKHSAGSLHYTGAAIDARTRNLSHLDDTRRQGLVVAVRDALGDDFDVIDEGNHLHIEFQPKKPYGV